MTLFSVVFQDFCVFSFPLGQNVTTSLEYDEQKVWRCLEQAGFAERAEKMPKGLDTALYKDFEEDGVEISGGEAQKIALARALYKDAPFIVLDEPTPRSTRCRSMKSMSGLINSSEQRRQFISPTASPPAASAIRSRYSTMAG